MDSPRQTNSPPGSPRGYQLDQSVSRHPGFTAINLNDRVAEQNGHPRLPVENTSDSSFEHSIRHNALYSSRPLDVLNQGFPDSFNSSGSSPQPPAYQPHLCPTLPPLPGVPGVLNSQIPLYPPTPTYPHSYPALAPSTERVSRGRYDPARGARLREENERLNPYRSRGDNPPQRDRSRSPANNYPEPLPGFFGETSPLPASSSTQRYQEPRTQRQSPSQEIARRDENELKDPACEFSAPCHMGPSPDGMHWRKVVSHVFGRNKASTKLFPQYVWVHYCRKHYQRARYRADQWPFTQCDLLLESLNRMERWGGVKSFELILRRREQLRVDAEPPAESKERSARARSSGSGIRKETRSSRALTAPQRSRKHPTAINAPVPSWLRELVGKLKSFEDVRELIEHVRAYLSDLRKEEREEQLTLSMSPTPSLAVSPRHAAGNDRKRLVKSTASAFKNNQRLQNSRVRFPDVEILPTFKPWVVEAALRQRSSGKREVNEESQPSDIPDNERIVDLDGSPETSDTRDGSAHAHTAEDLPDAPANAESEQVRRTQQTQQTEDLSQSQIGRAGANSGASESQRRRSLRVYLDSLNQVSGKGSVQKPREKKR